MLATVLHSYLFAWLFVLGISLGSLANLMVQSLTGGRWVEPVRPAWLGAARMLPWVAMLFVPIAVGVREIYPWTDAHGRYLNVPFFLVRSLAYLATWCVLAWGYLGADRLSVEAAEAGGRAVKAWSAAGLVVFAFTASLAGVDWVASLTPTWYSSGFGLVFATAQMLSGAAFGVMMAGLAASRGASWLRQRESFHDLGNLLLMYVMVWAYLAFTQFLIIWSEDLPKEIQWYVGRLETGWVALAWFVVVAHFALPLLILLSRTAKRSPAFMFALAAALLAVHALDVYWMVMPSVRPAGLSVAWSDPLAIALLAAVAYFLWRRAVRAPRTAVLVMDVING